jgi:hypothetical protein
MSHRMWTVALILLAAVVLACKAEGPPSDFCVINADNPHISSVGLARGVREITGKGWFKCTRSPIDIRVYVEIQRKGFGAWITVAQPPPVTFTNPPAGKKSKDVVAATPCAEGRFRTRARASGTDYAGNHVEQTEWSLSAEAVDPCAKGKT